MSETPMFGKEDRAAKEARDRAEWISEWQGWLVGATIMTGIWGVVSLRAGELKFYWPVVPLGIWALILLSYLIWHDE